jgi:RND family efflux transporter MFP subunit
VTFTRQQLYVAGLVLVLGVGGAAGAYYVHHRNQARDAMSTDVIAVTTQPAKVTTLREMVTAAGTVVPQVAADFVVTAPESCAIAELPKAEGETVQAGDIIVRLDLPAVASELATRQLEVADASAHAETARAEATRQASLFDRGLVGRNQAEAAKSALSVAESNLSQAKSRFETAKIAELATIIRARFAGVVVKRWHNVGDLVTGLETDPIMRIVDTSRLQISAPMPTADAVRVLPGQSADVQSESGPLAAVVALKLGGSVPNSPTSDVRLNFVVPTTLPLDTPLQLSIVVNERLNVLVVPADALQRAEGQTFVWIADANNQATRREVRSGYITNGQAEIVSGLTAGEQVIVTGISELTEGTRITIGR